jgi:hypothetical protein
MKVRIYQPTKTAMQSGRANTRRWVLEFEPATPRTTDPLMGWTSSADMRRQLRIYFDSREEAVAHAERNGLAYSVEEAHSRKIQPKSYADNFRFDRVGRWTH